MRMSLRAVNTEGISTNNGGLMVIYMIILLPFLSISGVAKLLDAGQYQAYQSTAFVLLAGLVILKARHLRLNKFTLLYIAYQLWVLLVSTKNNGLNLGLWVVVFSGIFIVMLMQVDMPVIVRALTWLTVSAVIINLVYMFYLGSYGQQEYFVGGKNSFSIFMVPSAFLLIINTLLRKKTLNTGTYLYVALVTFCILWGGSATGMVTAVAMIAGLFWITRKNPKIKTVMTVMIIMNVLLVFFTKVLIDSGLWRGFTSMLGKDISLTSRTGIWESVVKMLRNNWLMGCGRGTRIVFVGQWSKRSVVSETHNFLLEILFNGGVIGLMLYALFFREAIRKLNVKYMHHRMVYLAILVVLVNGLAESVTNKTIVNLFIGMAYAMAARAPVEESCDQDAHTLSEGDGPLPAANKTGV